MKLFKRLNWLGLALVATMMSALTSCSSEDPVSSIPGNVDFAATVNLQKLMDVSQCRIENGDIKLPEGLSVYEQSIPDDVKEVLADCYEAVDCSRIAVFGYIKLGTGADTYVVATLKDQKALDAVLVDKGDLVKSDNDGYTTYEPESEYAEMAILVKDGLVWFVGGKRAKAAVKAVEKVKDKAGDKKLIDEKGLEEVITADNVINFSFNCTPVVTIIDQFAGFGMDPEQAVLLSSVVSKVKGYWLTCSFDIRDKSFDTMAKFIKPGGEVLTYDLLQDIDPGFLTYVSKDYQVVTATGLNNKAINEIVAKIRPLLNNLSGSDRQMAEMMLGWVSNIDGTMGIAFGADDFNSIMTDDGVPQNINVLLTLAMKPGKAKEMVSQLYNLVSVVLGPEASNAIMLDADGSVVARIPGAPIFTLKAEGDDLLLSTNKITTGNANNEIAQVMKGAQMASYYNVASLSDMTAGACTFGVKSEGRLVDGVATGTSEFTNCDMSLAEAVVKLCTSYYAAVRNNVYKKYAAEMAEENDGIDDTVAVADDLAW